MDYIVLDLEWNQSPDGKGTQRTEIPFEIVEIGAVKLNAKFEIADTFSEIVAPSVYKEMHYVTKELIHLDMDQLKKGRPFPEVLGRTRVAALYDCMENRALPVEGGLTMTLKPYSYRIIEAVLS